LRRLSATLDFPFAALSAEAGAASAAPTSFAISKIVTSEGWFDKLTIYPSEFLTSSWFLLNRTNSLKSPKIKAFFFATDHPFICFSLDSASWRVL
jgi:hypothetical protein